MDPGTHPYSQTKKHHEMLTYAAANSQTARIKLTLTAKRANVTATHDAHIPTSTGVTRRKVGDK